jgi:hypothetical protein
MTTKPVLPPKHEKDRTGVVKPSSEFVEDKRSVARQEHSNHFTNRAPGDSK